MLQVRDKDVQVSPLEELEKSRDNNKEKEYRHIVDTINMSLLEDSISSYYIMDNHNHVDVEMS